MTPGLSSSSTRASTSATIAAGPAHPLDLGARLAGDHVSAPRRRCWDRAPGPPPGGRLGDRVDRLDARRRGAGARPRRSSRRPRPGWPAADRAARGSSPACRPRAGRAASRPGRSCPGDLGRVRELVVDVAGVTAHPAARQAADELVGGQLDVDGPVDLGPALGQGRLRAPRPARGCAGSRRGSRHRPRRARPAGRRSIWIVMSSGTSWPRSMYRRASRPMGEPSRTAAPEQVAGRDVRDAEPLGQQVGLRPLARPRSTEEHHDRHELVPGHVMARQARRRHRMKPS